MTNPQQHLWQRFREWRANRWFINEWMNLMGHIFCGKEYYRQQALAETRRRFKLPDSWKPK